MQCNSGEKKQVTVLMILIYLLPSQVFDILCSVSGLCDLPHHLFLMGNGMHAKGSENLSVNRNAEPITS